VLELWTAGGLLLVAAALFLTFRTQRLRRIARERLNENVAQVQERQVVRLAPALRRYLWIPWTLAAAVAVTVRLLLGIDLLYALALAVIVGVIGYIIESWIHGHRRLLLETQLADAIDLMVAALGAGSGIMEAVESAASESRPPLKAELSGVLGRIRLGDRPRQVFEDLATRIPLEVYRLFAFTLAVHGETGGSLAPTLSTVGRTIRDRIEIGRRVRSQSTQAQASVIGIVCISYFLALLMWRTNPASFEEFLVHPVGVNVTAGAVVLQAVGLLWITRLAQLRY
jgi:tight adherence protein B